jgi:hypothetical protein
MRSFDVAVAGDRASIAGQVSIRIGCMPKMNEARLALAARKVRRLLGFSEPDE